MCSQLAIPVMAPFCSLVLPCTVKSFKKINKKKLKTARKFSFTEQYTSCQLWKRKILLFTPDIQLSPTSGHSGLSFPSPWTHGSCMWWAQRAFHWLTWLESKPTKVHQMGKKCFVNIRQKLHCTNNIVFWMCIYPESRNELKLTHFLQQLPFILEESSIMPWEKKTTQYAWPAH